MIPEFEKDILPDKLSDLIEIALNDLKKIEVDPDYAINMVAWHSGTLEYNHEDLMADRVPCRVCLAGAVMANTFKLPIDLEIKPGDLTGNVTSDSLMNKFFVLDVIRCGQVNDAISQFYEMVLKKPRPDFKWRENPEAEFVEYRCDRERWKKWAEYLIAKLRYWGL